MPICPSCEHEVAEGARFCPFCGGNLSVLSQAGEDPYAGRLVAGKYLVEALIGEGGMGRVYKAVQQPLDKTVVLKVLRQAFQGDASLVARFQREARAASRLSHPNSIAVTDFGQIEDGALFIAMEYLDGRDLAAELAAVGPLPEKRIVHIVTQVLSALAEAHAASVIHRDLKPENIVIVPRRDDPDFVKVLDFGIAKIQDPAGEDSVALTQAGLVCGTPEYMSPEQARGEALDPRSDLYSVGVILYQLSTGRLPFTAETSVGIVTKHLVEAPPLPRSIRPEVTPEMEALILRCMAKDREARPATAEALAEALRGVEAEAASRATGDTAVSPAQVPPAAVPPGPAAEGHAGTTDRDTLARAQAAAAAPAPEVAPAASAPDDDWDAPVKQTRGWVWGAGVVAIALAFGGGYLAVHFLRGGGARPAAVAAGKPAAAAPAQDETAPARPAPTKPDAAPAPKAHAAAPGTPKPAAHVDADDAHPKAVRHAGTRHHALPSPPLPADHHRGAPTAAQRARARKLRAAGDGFWAHQDFAHAIAKYRAAARLVPDDPALQRKLGLGYLTLGKTGRAKPHLKRYLKLSPHARDRKMIQRLLAR